MADTKRRLGKAGATSRDDVSDEAVSKQGAPPLAAFITSFMDKGVVDVDRVAHAFRMSKRQLAETAGTRCGLGVQGEPSRGPQGADARDRDPGDHQPGAGVVGRRGASHGLVSLTTDPCPRWANAGGAGQSRPRECGKGVPRSCRPWRLRLRFVGRCYRAHDPAWSFTPLSGAARPRPADASTARESRRFTYQAIS